MSFKLLQFPPQASTRTMYVQVRWMGPDSGLGGREFLGSWLGDENNSDQRPGRINWGAIGGLALSFAISVGFWAGLGVLVSRALR